jgi:hypothetical protein
MDKDSGIVYHLVHFSTFYLLPVAAIMTLYVSLAFYLQRYTDRVSIGWLITVEQRLAWASSFFDRYFTYSEGYILTALILVFLASCLGIYLQQRRQARGHMPIEPPTLWARRAYRLIGNYHRYSVAIGMCLALLASLTFFGMKLGKPTDELALRIKTAQDGYALIEQRAEEELAQRVTELIYEKIRTSLPPSYLEALERKQDELDARILAVQAELDKAERYGITDPATEALLQDELQRLEALDRLETSWWIGGSDSSEPTPNTLSGRASPPKRLPERFNTNTKSSPDRARPIEPGKAEAPARLSTAFTESTLPQIEKAAAAWKAQPAPLPMRVVREGETLIMLQVARVIAEGFSEFAKSLAPGIPLLDPLLTALTEVLGETAQQKIEESQRRAVTESIRNPGDLKAIVEREATQVAASLDVTTAVDRAAPRSEAAATRITDSFTALAGKEAQIATTVVDKLIADFNSPVEEVVREASWGLNDYALNQAQTDRLLSIMEKGTRSWKQSYRPTGAHCTDVTTTSVRYYAAGALLDNRHLQLSEPQRKRCAQVRENSKSTVRHHDPGWICFF